MFLLVPAYPGCTGPKAIKRLCVCVGGVIYKQTGNTMVPVPPGKSWNSFCKISCASKLLENEFGPGNLSAWSWKVPEFAGQ